MEFPMLFSIAMDYLPVQATSISCEHVFSSAKDTDTAKRNQINPVLMEALQMLKYALKKECLSFTNGWPTSKADMNRVSKSVPADSLNSLFGDNPHNALDQLLQGFLNDDDSQP
jgi:hAT family C-terminal dimerisation region